VDLGVFFAMNAVESVISLILLGCKALAFADAVVRPAEAFVAVDKQSKVFWVLVLGLFLVAHLLMPAPIGILNLIGTVAAFVYLADARPALRELGRGRR
jgi:hypothetical protein